MSVRNLAAVLLSFAICAAASAADTYGTQPAGKEAPKGTPKGSNLQGTPEEQAACNVDAARFCSDDIPDTFKVLECLKEHRARLKKSCVHVLESHGQ
jgi:hypothetical protein